MAYRGEIPDDFAEEGPVHVSRSAPVEPDELLRHLERLGIDLHGFDADPMEEHHASAKRYEYRAPRRLRA